MRCRASGRLRSWISIQTRMLRLRRVAETEATRVAGQDPQDELYLAEGRIQLELNQTLGIVFLIESVRPITAARRFAARRQHDRGRIAAAAAGRAAPRRPSAPDRLPAGP